MRTRTVLGLGAAICGAASLVPAAAGAATITVNNTSDTFADDGQCSLREAVQTANSNVAVNATGGADCTVGSQHPTADTIQLAAATYTLALAGSGGDNNLTGDLDVRVDNGGTAGGPVTIAGLGSGQTEIDAADLDRVLHVTVGPGTLTLQGLRLDNGTAPATESGGALFNNQASATNVVMSDVRVSDSVSPVSGGGIFWPSNGTLTLSNGSQVDGNAATSATASDVGGGILFSNGTLNITDSTISGNTGTISDPAPGTGAGAEGGGVAIQNATLNLTRSTISGNTLSVPNNADDFPDGGGVYAQNTTATIVDSTLSGNSVSGGNQRSGGGYFHFDQDNTANNPLTIQNSTFSGNSVTSNANSTGGALRVTGGIITVTASTFSGNTAATNQGDALYATAPVTQTNESFALRSSIFNEGTNGCAYPSFQATSSGYNLETDDTCWAVNGTGDQQNTAVSLAALASNGGSTQTHELQSGSNGLDDVPNADCDEADGDPLPADQRGVPRPQGAACDVGAYERAGTCLGQVATAVGTGSGETINGTSNNDVILALGGADTVNAGDGADRVCGGDGNDTIRGGDGNDADLLDGEGDTDTASFSDLSAAVTAASLAAGTTAGTQVGTDTLTSFEGMVGSDFSDGTSTPLNGSSGPNTIDGGAGNDTIQGGGGDDTLIGGANPAVALPGSPGDTASFLNSGMLNPITASLLTGTATGEGTDTLTGFESLTGGSAGDTLTGNSGINSINGFSGDDTLEGREGNDFFTGGPDDAGGDTVAFSTVAGGVDASLSAGALSATGQGTDGGNTIENLTGSGNDDTLTGDGGPNVLTGGNGGDVLRDGSSDNAPANADTFIGGPAFDTASYVAKGAAEPVIVNLVNTTGQGEGGENDTVAADVESVTGGAGNDILTGDEGANTLTGAGGADTITGGLGSDDVFGGAGADDLLIRDLLADDADCGPADAATDTVTADDAATDTLTNCEADTVAFGPAPTSNPAPTQTGTPAAATTATRKCRKGSKLKKVKTKSGKVKRKCVKKRKKRA